MKNKKRGKKRMDGKEFVMVVLAVVVAMIVYNKVVNKVPFVGGT